MVRQTIAVMTDSPDAERSSGGRAPGAPGERHHLLKLFSVPLALVDGLVDDATNRSIAQWILAEEQRDGGVDRSIVGGWHSQPDLPIRGVEVLDRLFNAIIEQVRSVHSRLSDGNELQARFMLQAWATVMRHGDYVQVHDHAGAHWSVVYYVDVGDADVPESGRISWINPVGCQRSVPGAELVPTTFACEPRTGCLAVFPGWLRHSVEPYRGERPRIAISANIEVRQVRD